MLTLEEVQDGLQDRVVTVVCEATGLCKDTVRRVRDGKAPRVEYTTIKILSDYLSAK